jgi:predicted nucleic acid-binding protein
VISLEKASMTPDYNVFIDTNILIYASLKDFEPEKHRQSQKALKEIMRKTTSVFISSQIIREFFAVVTNPRYVKTPLSAKQANSQITFFQSIFTVLPVTETTAVLACDLAEKHNITGQKIHDTTIAATILESNISRLLTFNTKDFKIFEEITTISPETL